MAWRRSRRSVTLSSVVGASSPSKASTNGAGKATHEKSVYIAEKNVGSIQLKGDEATLVVRANATLNGRILVTRDGTAWRGVIDHGNGTKWAIVFRPKEETIKEKPARKKPK